MFGSFCAAAMMHDFSSCVSARTGTKPIAVAITIAAAEAVDQKDTLVTFTLLLNIFAISHFG